MCIFNIRWDMRFSLVMRAERMSNFRRKFQYDASSSQKMQYGTKRSKRTRSVLVAVAYKYEILSTKSAFWRAVTAHPLLLPPSPPGMPPAPPSYLVSFIAILWLCHFPRLLASPHFSFVSSLLSASLFLPFSLYVSSNISVHLQVRTLSDTRRMWNK